MQRHKPLPAEIPLREGGRNCLRCRGERSSAARNPCIDQGSLAGSLSTASCLGHPMTQPPQTRQSVPVVSAMSNTTWAPLLAHCQGQSIFASENAKRGAHLTPGTKLTASYSQ